MLKKSLFLLFALCALCMSTVVTFAAGNSNAGTTQPSTTSSTSGQATPSSPNDGNGLGIDIHPIDANEAAQGFVKMGKDMGTVAGGIAIPFEVYGIAAASVLIIIGVFNKKVLVAGVGMFGAVLLISLVLGDFMKTVQFFNNIGATVRHYWS